MINETNIQKILLDCLDQKEKARRQLYDLYIDRLYHTTQRITNNHHDTQDVLQQAFVKVFNKIETYNQEYGTVFSWMCRICINEAISHLRKRKLTFLEITTQCHVEVNEANALESLSIDYIANAIEKLPDAQRLIFTLYEVEGYTHDEIAIQLKISTPTSRSYLSRAKSKLQSLISVEMNKINSL